MLATKVKEFRIK